MITKDHRTSWTYILLKNIDVFLLLQWNSYQTHYQHSKCLYLGFKLLASICKNNQEIICSLGKPRIASATASNTHKLLLIPWGNVSQIRKVVEVIKWKQSQIASVVVKTCISN